MSVHIGAKQGEIAETVLLPGDPLRAKYIAETYLEDVHCYNDVRGMYGFTGTYQGHRISVQGTGMGMPSAAIYCTELIQDYGVKHLIRVGTCGAISEDAHVRDVILAQGAATSSSMIKNVFPNYTFPATATFDLLHKAYQVSGELGVEVHVGNVVSDDVFYKDSLDDTFKLGRHGILAVEMEAAAIYYLAQKYHVDALAIMTVSDHLVTGEETTATERQTTFNDMIKIALNTAVQL